MPGTAVVDSGNYDLKIATGFQVDAFVLDDALKGVLDNTTYVLDGTTEFADVMDSVTTITVRRGRRDVGDQFSAGTMSFTIQDTFGIFNPFDQNSPYWDTSESKPGLAPLREVRLIRYSSTDVPKRASSCRHVVRGVVAKVDCACGDVSSHDREINFWQV